MATDKNSPFGLLQDYERRSLAHAVGVPEQVQAPGSWSGIGFSLFGHNLAAAIDEVSEIIDYPAVTKVPAAQDWLMGIGNIRGNLIAVVDLRRLFTGERTQMGPATRLLILRQTGGGVGIIIDQIKGQKRFSPEQLADDDAFATTALAGFIEREYREEGTTWGILDTGALLNSPDFMQAAA